MDKIIIENKSQTTSELDIVESYGGEKSLNIIEGDHNTPRPKHILESVKNYFIRKLWETN